MKPRNIYIETVLNGYIVKVGCQRIVFTSQETMTNEIRKYLSDPEAMEKKYKENGLYFVPDDVVETESCATDEVQRL
jgi:hypothetical protein